MTIKTPTYYSAKGQRKVNEDFVFPEKPKSDSKLFMVCDGVGGEHSGEIASKLTGLAINEYITNSSHNIEEALEYSIRHAHELVQKFTHKFPSTKGMASTVAMLYKEDNKFFAAWVGDSRVYHIRNGQVIFQSKDHSYWQWMKERGMLDDPDTYKKNLKFKNLILQAIGGTNRLNPDVVEIEDIQPNDYFILLTDGILEAHPEEQFPDLFKTEKNNEEILEEIISLCHKKSKDNFSAYLLKVT